MLKMNQFYTTVLAGLTVFVLTQLYLRKKDDEQSSN